MFTALVVCERGMGNVHVDAVLVGRIARSVAFRWWFRVFVFCVCVPAPNACVYSRGCPAAKGVPSVAAGVAAIIFVKKLRGGGEG